MSPEAVATVGREALMTLLMVAAPAMLVALIVGLLIGLLQALTSIQEVTLTFVPKIILVFVVILLAMPFMASALQQFTEAVFMRMANVETTSPLGAQAE